MFAYFDPTKIRIGPIFQNSPAAAVRVCLWNISTDVKLVSVGLLFQFY